MDNKENNTKERMSLPYYMGFAAKMLFRYSVTLVEMKLGGLLTNMKGFFGEAEKTGYLSSFLVLFCFQRG